MTEQEQQEFIDSLEAVQSWIHVVQERLRVNDNTQGPRAALQARLRETEKIHESEHEGRVKMDMVLVAAEVLLQNGDQETRSKTHAKLKELKASWEETCTFIIHCHSRIEWVWLHWSEYLKAHEEVEMWLVRMRRSLEPEVELQLGVKEKLWQVDHQHVLLSDVQSQALLLERLLDEAAALHNRTQDPSVDQEAQERLQEAYNSIRDGAEERLSVLQKIAEEHQIYQSYVLKFQAWLVSKAKELNTLTESEDTAENNLQALQTLDDSVASEERTLQHIEGMVEAVRANTSPGGVEVVEEEVEELRLAWQRLRQSLCEAGEGLRSSLDSQSQYQSHCQRLGEDIAQLQALLHRLTRDLETAREGDRTEEQMVGQWRKYMNVRNTLSAEESQVENLKAQLKELFRFSQDSRHLSDDVLAVVKEHQSVKCRAMKLCVESETGLRLVLQDPLHGFSQWSQLVSQVLEASAEVSEFSHIALLVQNIERLMMQSLQLQERLSLLQVKRDLLVSVFGSDRAESLLTELNAAVKNRELLHSQLLQRKGRLQGLISRTKDFGDAYESIRSKLTLLRDRLISADILQPDILAKKSQSDQLRGIKKDLEDCEAHITALETLVSSSSTNKTRSERLYGDWRNLYKAVRVKGNESEESIREHESFHESLLNVEKWLMIMRQKLESYRSSAGEWSVDNRQHEAERALGEFPEKELQLHQTEVEGQGVLKRTSEEGRVHILRDMKRLRESWMALHDLSLNLFRYITEMGDQSGSGGGHPRHRGSFTLIKTKMEDPVMDQGFARKTFGGLQSSSQHTRVRFTIYNDSINSQSHTHYFLVNKIISTSNGHGIITNFVVVVLQADPGSALSAAEYEDRRRIFEAWLQKENDTLSGILNTKGPLSTRELKIRQNTLKTLRSSVGWGQEQFQLLLMSGAAASGAGDGADHWAEDVGMEEIRYRWMLYKSKLKDVGDLKALLNVKVRDGKTPGLLYRVCRVALPLWLLLLALLLFAFFLPWMDEGSSCSLSNNFARSFNIMLRYDGPPPT
uniref:Spectrin repeat containing, nuclear envelope family member 3 n=1 Tax=Oncorhynchus kisutch TaxID=8019 RepID=A0A8C7MGX4_ONCKI